MKRTRGSYPGRHSPPAERLEPGRTIRDPRTGLAGVVVDVACQYAHPKAEPVYNYLVRWEDGQVQAIAEGALVGDFGYEITD